jgi:cytochrome oxidase Cu insertion factor (SCO1/SenC/PrrC family)
MKPIVQLESGAAKALRILLTAAILVVPGCGVSAKTPQSGNVIRFVRNPDAAPEFQLDGLDGKPLSLASERGKVVLLNFWATCAGRAGRRFRT